MFSKLYSLSPEKEERISEVISALKAQGIIIPIVSVHNTPVNPVRKPGRKGWRFTQDLRHINDLVSSLAPVVPDVSSFFMAIPSQHTFYSC